MPVDTPRATRERVVRALSILEGKDRRYQAIREALEAPIGARDVPLPIRLRSELAARLRIDPERIRIEVAGEARLTVRVRGRLGGALDLRGELASLLPRDRAIAVDAWIDD